MIKVEIVNYHEPEQRSEVGKFSPKETLSIIEIFKKVGSIYLDADEFKLKDITFNAQINVLEIEVE